MTSPLARSLPQCRGVPMVTDGGVETDLIFHHDVELPHFAAFPLVDSEHGRALLNDYFLAYALIAWRANAGLLLESVTWRANPDWGSLLGYDAAELARVNRAAVEMLCELRDACAADGNANEIVISGTVGPRGDGYRPGEPFDPADAAAYHLPQVRALASAGADLVTAYTLTDVGEAIGITAAARDVGVPVAISFTVETDGRLAGGTTVADAIEEVDAAQPPDYFLLNCAHPSHIAPAFDRPGHWQSRLHGMRYNASTRSHAELDESDELDEGDIDALSAGHAQLAPTLPNLAIVGGCCGTDARHVASLWGV